MPDLKLGSSVGFKVFVIGCLVIFLLIPTFFIQSVVNERKNRREEVLKDITSKWGESQALIGPMLVIPVEFSPKDSKGNVQTVVRFIYLLPDSLHINGELLPEIRYRSIYRILLYTADLDFSGTFDLSNLRDIEVKDGNIDYENAFLEFGLSDLKGVNNPISVSWNDGSFVANPGIITTGALEKGVHVKSPLAAKKRLNRFAMNIDVNGSEEITFLPVGKETNVAIHSNWPHPSFTGEFLPQVHNVEKDAFQAHWKALNFNRNFPQISYNDPIKFDKTFFGVKLYYPVDQYQKTTRTVKYAIMFIGLTFLAYFLIEILNKQQLHPIQYLLVGSGLVLFYILLLSLSEHIHFQLAYLCSAVAMVLLTALYTRAILRDRRFMILISAVLTGLYGFLYVNLQLQDYALLLGSIGLFVTLALVMYLTRKVDWFTVLKPAEESVGRNKAAEMG